MKTYFDCIPCFLKQSLEAARMATDDVNVHSNVLKEVMNHLQTISFSNSPPEISREVHQIIKHLTNSEDPYLKVKNQSNLMAKKMLPKLKKMVNEADDSLLMSIKLAIAGNVIDFGTSNRFNVEDIVKNIMKKDFVDQGYKEFKKTLREANNILYLADNSGEIFFDKILIEEFVKLEKKVTFVVKSNPIINDANLDDAKFAGIDNIASVIAGDKGQKISAPGMLMPYVSNEFLELFKTSDMVISKGQGNYECLSNTDRKIFFLLMIKCPLVAKDIGIDVGKLVLKVKN